MFRPSVPRLQDSFILRPNPRLMRLVAGIMLPLACFAHLAAGQEAFPQVEEVPRQPLLAQVQRLVDALDYLGSPLNDDVKTRLRQLKEQSDDARITREVQSILDPWCLMSVTTTAEEAPRLHAGPAEPRLTEQGWETFLIKVNNATGSEGRLLLDSPNAKPLPHAPASEVSARWMQLASFEGRPLNPNLSGLALEYRIVQIYSRNAGPQQGLLEVSISEEGKPGDAIRQWRFDEDTDGWSAMNQAELTAEDGSLVMMSLGEDPFIGAPVSARSGPMVLRFWGRSSTDGVGQLFWWTEEKPQADGNRQVNFVLHPNKDALYEIPFHPVGELAGVRLDPLIKPGRFRIDWIDLYPATRSSRWATLPVQFESRPATEVTFRILDAYGKPGFARLVIRNEQGQIFPAQSKRLAPDFFFQQQIYRGDQEKIRLPAGNYQITCSRGPETITETRQLNVGQEPVEFFYRVKRWIDPALDGWFSGDHHIHAAGCLHYENPTEGVMPEDMIRHIMGEDLKVGCCLTWGPCFDFQKRFFTGETAEQSRYPYTLRYDVEVSGFGSHQSGHLNLLNLQEQIYPGGESKSHWPTLGLNTLRWAKRQGAVCGPAHSAIGLTRFVGRVPDTTGRDGPGGLPNFQIPAFDGIGANEFIMDVTHQVTGPDGLPVRAIDFISAMNTERVAEWNIWYHVLNCGIRVAVSGETDFPCISGDRVGLGRVYAKVDGPLTFAKWVAAIAQGRSYVSDGTCHLMDFRAQPATTGTPTVFSGVDASELPIGEPMEVTFSCDITARDLTRENIEVELIINGYPVEKRQVPADGQARKVQFTTRISDSSWAAIRSFPRAHTNPIFVIVDEKPIRADSDSARWCLASVKQCWKSKQPTYAAEEQQQARADYDHAILFYERILREAEARKEKQP